MRSFSTTTLPHGSSFSSIPRNKRSSPKQSLAEQRTEELDEEAEEEEAKSVSSGCGDEPQTRLRPHRISDCEIGSDSANICDALQDESTSGSVVNEHQSSNSSSERSPISGETTRGCLLCGKKRSRASFESTHIVPAVWPNTEPPPLAAARIDNLGRYVTKDGLAYDIDELAVDPLLNLISEWDYPIFELRDAAGDAILSELSYRIFLEAGLFDAFKIPLQVCLLTAARIHADFPSCTGVLKLLQGFRVRIQGKAL